ncbi:MAG: ABC transporter ATP-binding protein/permease [Cellvibrionaceae bacterium]|nr:ABC transporter ATP-binding protein/permease [Cellvibrionaceae bacterium]
MPILIIYIIDEQLLKGSISGFGFSLACLLGVILVNYLSDAAFSFYLRNAALHAISDLRKAMLARIMRFPRSYFDRTPIGITLTRLTTDLEAINESFTQGLLGMIRDTLITVSLLIFLLTISWQLTLIMLFVGPVVYLLTEILRRKLRHAYNQGRSVLAQGTGFLQESLNGIKTVQLYNAEKSTLETYKTFTRGFFNAQSKCNLYDATLFSCIEGVTTTSVGLIIWYGSGELLASAITTGALVGFIHTLDKIFVPIRDFTAQVAAIQRAMAAFEHIEEIFTQQREDEAETPLPPIDTQQLQTFDTLRFIDVRFRYSESGPDVLRGINFTLKKGQKLALVGGTGSGKSTILRLLTRTYDNYTGSILINGIELRRIPKQRLAKFFALMQQDVHLFNESVAFNIGLAKTTLSPQAIQAAAQYVYADTFIEQLPDNYQFRISNNGGNLSSGQGQLIAFARAIASQQEVIMLDEATAAVDSLTEKTIHKAIDHVFEEKTVIAIAHRLSTIEHADQILVLDKGHIVEAGQHAVLKNAAGPYAALLQSLSP